MVYIFIFMEVSSSSLATQDKNISSYLTSSNWEYEADSNDALKTLSYHPIILKHALLKSYSFLSVLAYHHDREFHVLQVLLFLCFKLNKVGHKNHILFV